MNRDELLTMIQALSFAKCEMELFLNTRPDCRAALEKYKSTVEELKMLKEQYENNYGPLTADGVVGDRWSWADSPWPWHLEANQNIEHGSSSSNERKGGRR